MIKVIVPDSFTTCFNDGSKDIAVLRSAQDPARNTVGLKVSGILRSDLQVHLGAELQFYGAACPMALEVDLAEVSAIAPGCFSELLDLKVKLQNRGIPVAFTEKSAAVAALEQKIGKKL